MAGGHRVPCQGFPGGSADETTKATAGQADREVAKTITTVMEILRQILVKQALRRGDGGALTPEEIERVMRGVGSGIHATRA